MIEYENAAGPTVRCIESDVAGRRVAALAAPYAGEAGVGSAYRFDPLERRLLVRRASGRVLVGPADSAAWARAISRCPPGPVLVLPGSAVEEIRGAHAAAVAGVAASGRGAYLLDPDAADLPAVDPRSFVVLCCWSPGEDGTAGRLAAARSIGAPAGGLLPVVPGWTDEPGFLDDWFTRVTAAGAGFVSAVPATGGGEERRVLVEALTASDPASADAFFEKVHHGDWEAAVRSGLRRFREEARRRGVPAIPPRPIGAAEPPGNSAAASQLEERALEIEDRDEHRSALLHAAARWIDESGRDLSPVVREGNFAKVFPFGSLADEAEAAFRGERP